MIKYLLLLFDRSLLDQTVKELQQQVSMMRQRESKVLEQNRELQHTILDLESKLEEVQDRSQTAFEMVRSLCTHCMPRVYHWVGAFSLIFAFWCVFVKTADFALNIVPCKKIFWMIVKMVSCHSV